MPIYSFDAFEVNINYYAYATQSPILSKHKLKITDGVDDDLHRTQAEDTNSDQTLDFVGELEVTDYTISFLDFAQVNSGGVDYELYAMEVTFSDGSERYFVMSKDPGFDPQIGDNLVLSSFSTFTLTDYGSIGSAVCFTPGATIQLENGMRAVEHVKIGDRVQTKDNGSKAVLWTGKRLVTARALSVAPALRPIRIEAGTLGNTGAMLVSPQHRVLMQGHFFGAALPWDEAFVKARHLAEFGPGRCRIAKGVRSVIYIHILLEGHQVIFANGMETESLSPGPMATQSLSRRDVTRIDTSCPELATGQGWELARPVVPRRILKSIRAEPLKREGRCPSRTLPGVFPAK